MWVLKFIYIFCFVFSIQINSHLNFCWSMPVWNYGWTSFCLSLTPKKLLVHIHLSLFWGFLCTSPQREFLLARLWERNSTEQWNINMEQCTMLFSPLADPPPRPSDIDLDPRCPFEVLRASCDTGLTQIQQRKSFKRCQKTKNPAPLFFSFFLYKDDTNFWLKWRARGLRWRGGALFVPARCIPSLRGVGSQ